MLSHQRSIAHVFSKNQAILSFLGRPKLILERKTKKRKNLLDECSQETLVTYLRGKRDFNAWDLQALGARTTYDS